MSLSKLAFHTHKQVFVYRLDGKMKYLPRAIKTLEEAQVEYAKVADAYKLLNPEEGINPNDRTLSTYIDAYYHDCGWAWKKENASAKHLILDDLKRHLGDKKMKTVTQNDVAKWLALHLSWGETYRNSVLKHVSAAWNHCIRTYEVRPNPLVGWKGRPQAKARGEEAVIGDKEHAALMPYVHERYRDVLEILHLSGARPSEILDATGAEYQPEHHRLNKKKWKTMATTKKRHVILCEKAEAIILAAIATYGKGLLFPREDGEQIGHQALRAEMVTAKRKAGIERPLYPYGYRHAMATKLIEAGTPIAEVAEMLDDSIATIERHYVHKDGLQAGLRERLNKMNNS